MVGPEGGWAPGEVLSLVGQEGTMSDDDLEDGAPKLAAVASQRRVWRVSLGKNILRAETAAMYVLSACSAVEAAAGT